MKKKPAQLDAPRVSSLWPEKPLTKDSPLPEILKRIPDYFERAIEALQCIESRCARATATKGLLTPAQTRSLELTAVEMRAMLGTLRREKQITETLVAQILAKQP